MTMDVELRWDVKIIYRTKSSMLFSLCVRARETEGGVREKYQEWNGTTDCESEFLLIWNKHFNDKKRIDFVDFLMFSFLPTHFFATLRIHYSVFDLSNFCRRIAEICWKNTRINEIKEAVFPLLRPQLAHIYFHGVFVMLEIWKKNWIYIVQ